MTSCTAGIVMIGDEILKGQIVDTNSNFLTKRLHSWGVKVCKIVIVSDDVDEIAEEVARFSKKYTIVVTSGGIGPTHDDVTYSGIAKAFDESIVLNSEMAHEFRWFCPGSSTDVESNPALKVAQVPKSSKLIYVNLPKCLTQDSAQSSTNKFPVVQVRNVYIFPGIPELFEQLFSNLEHIFKNANCTFYSHQLFVTLDEFQILPILNCAVKKYKHTVTFGSYPCITCTDYSTKLTIESTSKHQAQDAENFLRNALPAESIVDYKPDHPISAMDTVYDVARKMTKGKFSFAVKEALNVLEECCDKFNSSEIFLSFNGGKDCTVLLDLTCAALKKKYPNSKDKLQAVYIQSQNPFPEVEAFIKESSKRYGLDIVTEPGPIKNALEVVLKRNPHLKAVLMGTRRTDPFSEHLQTFQMTDESWPQVMRVSPLLNWSYDDVWKYLIEFGVPYCTLYDHGYTSLGNRNNTSQNPALSFTTNDGCVHYHPAHKLMDGSAERNGRL